jgi:hypothetical protein
MAAQPSLSNDMTFVMYQTGKVQTKNYILLNSAGRSAQGCLQQTRLGLDKNLLRRLNLNKEKERKGD